MTTSQSYYDKLEQLLTDALQSTAERLSAKDRNDVSHYVDHAEYGGDLGFA